MSKAKKIVELISNWQELSAAVTRGSLVNARIETAKAEYIEKELELRKVLQAAIEPDSLILKGIKKAIKLFCDTHKEEFETERTKHFTHGSVGYRKNPGSVKPALGATEEEVLEILKSKKYTQYVKVKEVLNKEQIAADFREGVLTLRELSKLGLTIEKYNEDDFQLNFAASVDNAVPQV